MWIELNERLINLDGVIEAHYEDGELIMYFVDGAEASYVVSRDKWEEIRKTIAALMHKNDEMVYYISPCGSGGKGGKCGISCGSSFQPDENAPDGSSYIDYDGREVVKRNGQWEKWYAYGGGDWRNDNERGNTEDNPNCIHT